MKDEKEKKVSRSEKRYADSPKMERNDEGKMAVKKSERKAAAVDAGTDNAAHGDEMGKMMSRHAEERMKLHHKHDLEMMSHAHAGMKEEDKKEEPKKESGKEEMAKVKGDK